MSQEPTLPDLPPLPEPRCFASEAEYIGEDIALYSAEQMLAYGRACHEAGRAERVPLTPVQADAELLRVLGSKG